MAPLPKLHELPAAGKDGGLVVLHGHERSVKIHSRRWFLLGILANLCLTLLVVGAGIVYVNKELQSVRDKVKIFDDRLARLEDMSSKSGSVKIDVPAWKITGRRHRRHQDVPETPGRATPFLSGIFEHGKSSCSCRDGRDGNDGRAGPRGPAGPQGEKGVKGDTGIIEESGLPGIVGPRRQRRDVDDDLPIDSPTQDGNRPSGGDTYVRWGRTSCPNDAELVYAGIAAGSHYTHKGGSTDFFCLPSVPDWAASYNDGANSGSYLYGVEYEVSFDPFIHSNVDIINQRDVPCAVCRLVHRSTKLLLPATLGCPSSNWTEEYRGFLMSGHHGHEQRSAAICVDEAPEAIPGSQANADGALLYIVEGQCGALLCPPYVTGREITCTVCSI